MHRDQENKRSRDQEKSGARDGSALDLSISRSLDLSSAPPLGGEAPAEFLLLPYGVLDAPAPAAGPAVKVHFGSEGAMNIVEWFKRLGRELVVDYEHQTLPELNTRPDGLAPAAGWVGALEARADGLWATAVRWTQQARELLKQGAYRYFSPVLGFADQARTRIAALGPIALTNDPALRSIPALVAKAQPGEGLVLSVLSARVLCGSSSRDQEIKRTRDQDKGGARASALDLSLSRSLDLSQASDSTGRSGAHRSPGRMAGKEMTMDEIRKALDLAADADEAACVAAITALKRVEAELRRTTEEVTALKQRLETGATQAGQAEAALITKLQGEVTVLRQQVAQQTALSQKQEFEALVRSGDHAGKIPPADEPTYFELFKSQRATFDTVLKALPKVAASRSVFAGDPAAGSSGADGGNPERWKAEFAASAPLQQEFKDEATYVAFKQGERDGTFRTALK